MHTYRVQGSCAVYNGAFICMQALSLPHGQINKAPICFEEKQHFFHHQMFISQIAFKHSAATKVMSVSAYKICRHEKGAWSSLSILLFYSKTNLWRLWYKVCYNYLLAWRETTSFHIDFSIYEHCISFHWPSMYFNVPVVVFTMMRSNFRPL